MYGYWREYPDQNVEDICNSKMSHKHHGDTIQTEKHTVKTQSLENISYMYHPKCDDNFAKEWN